MTRYAITGPVEIDADAEALVRRVIQGLTDCTEFTSGAAYGVDTVAIDAAAALHPRPLLRLTVPDIMVIHNVAVVARGVMAGWTIERGPRGKTDSDTYMLRNDITVAHADVLLAFPPTCVEIIRGGPGAGTWSTVRRARKAGCEIRAWPLDRAAPWTEHATAGRLV